MLPKLREQVGIVQRVKLSGGKLLAGNRYVAGKLLLCFYHGNTFGTKGGQDPRTTHAFKGDQPQGSGGFRKRGCFVCTKAESSGGTVFPRLSAWHTSTGKPEKGSRRAFPVSAFT